MPTASDETPISASWEKGGATGNIRLRGKRKRNAFRKCLKGGHVHGYFSDLLIRPDLPPKDAMTPSVEHLVSPENHGDVVVETRVINDMRSILSKRELWQVIEHLFVVGMQKGEIQQPFGKRLPKGWSPKRHFKKPAQRTADVRLWPGWKVRCGLYGHPGGIVLSVLPMAFSLRELSHR